MMHLHHPAEAQATELAARGARVQLRLVGRLLKYCIPIWDKILLQLLAIQVGAAIGIIMAFLTARFVDEALVERDRTQFMTIIAMAFALAFLGHAFQLIAAVARTAAGTKVFLALQRQFYRHLQKSSVRFFQSRPVGEHLFRTTADLFDTSTLVSDLVPASIGLVQRLLTVGVLISYLGSWLLWAMLGYIVIYQITLHFITTHFRRWDYRWRMEQQGFLSVLREILTSSRLIAGYNRQRMAKRWFGTRMMPTVRAYFCRSIWLNTHVLLTLVGLGLFMSALPYISGTLVIRGVFSLGKFIAVPVAAQQVLAPVKQFLDFFQTIRQRLVPAERMFDTLDMEPELVDPPQQTVPAEPRGHVEFKNVTFAYDESAAPALQDVNLVVRPGEKVVIVGPSGAGKTTLTKLLLRLYDPQQGTVLVDGVDVRERSQENLRRHIGIAMQELFVFSTTIWENIRYGNPRATEEELLQASRISHVDDFAQAQPDGYETFLAEAGVLSGGQKQRLALSRALIRDPRILVLDEATSALDPILEKRVVADIDEAYGARTRMVIAHNLISVRNADRIYVLDKGHVVEVGQHDELMKAGGAYCRLWMTDSTEMEGDSS